MEIHRLQSEDLAAVYGLLCESGWSHRVGSLEHFVTLIEASQVAEVAVHEGRVIGFVRGITDAQSNGYLSMVVVSENHRGKGVGRALVERALSGEPTVTWVLRAGRDGAREFFTKLGFQHSDTAMERRRA